MPQISTQVLADVLRRHMREQKLSQKAAGELIGVSWLTIMNLLKGRSNPKTDTVEKITEYLQNVGELTRLKLPVRPLYEPDPIDQEALEDMGITPMPKGVPEFDLDKYVPEPAPTLSQAEKIRIIKQLDEDLVLKLFPTL